MKRLKSLAALLLALSMALCLCACGDKDTEEPADTPDDQSQTEVQDTPETDDGQDQQTAAGVDLNALKQKFITDYQYSDVLDVETAGLTNVYGLNADQIVASASFNATVGGAFPHEVVMIQATDASAAAAIQTALYEHLDGIAMQASSYDPESEALAKACGVVVEGNYVGMFFTDHAADMTTEFQNTVG